MHVGYKDSKKACSLVRAVNVKKKEQITTTVTVTFLSLYFQFLASCERKFELSKPYVVGYLQLVVKK
jgi:uncharacterized membrane protein (DUF485 family)